MEIKLSHCIVTVHDQDAALAFYHDILGFDIRNNVQMENMRWVTVGPASQPDIEIMLETPEMKPPTDRDAVRSLLAKGSMPGLLFSTDDCDATFEKIRAAGAEVLQEPIDQPYGVRDCAFRDPSGNMVRFGQQLAG